MLDFGFYNMDCMEGMKQFPDNYFELAVVDPPYGDGGGTWTNGTRFGQRFDRYLEPGSVGKHTQEASPEARGGVLDTTPSERGKTAALTRTGGTWASKFGKKSSRGTLRRSSRTLTNCSASHATRLYGGGIISIYLRRDVSWYGAN